MWIFSFPINIKIHGIGGKWWLTSGKIMKCLKYPEGNKKGFVIKSNVDRMPREDILARIYNANCSNSPNSLTMDFKQRSDKSDLHFNKITWLCAKWCAKGTALEAAVEAIRRVRQLLQQSNILEPGGQSKSPGKEDDLGIKALCNYGSLWKAVKGSVQLRKWLSVWSWAVFLPRSCCFFWNCVPLGPLQEQKLKLTNNCKSNKTLKGMLRSMKHRLPSKLNFILVSHHSSRLFSFRGTFPCCGEKLQQACDFPAHS